MASCSIVALATEQQRLQRKIGKMRERMVVHRQIVDGDPIRSGSVVRALRSSGDAVNETPDKVTDWIHANVGLTIKQLDRNGQAHLRLRKELPYLRSRHLYQAGDHLHKSRKSRGRKPGKGGAPVTRARRGKKKSSYKDLVAVELARGKAVATESVTFAHIARALAQDSSACRDLYKSTRSNRVRALAHPHTYTTETAPTVLRLQPTVSRLQPTVLTERSSDEESLAYSDVEVCFVSCCCNIHCLLCID